MHHARLRGLRASSFNNRSVACLLSGRVANLITAVTPVTSNRRNRSWPAWLIPPIRCLPPVECLVPDQSRPPDDGRI